MKNSTRNFVKIIREICDEDSIQLESYSYDWIFRLYKNGVYNYIIGYQFGLNSCAVHSICCDKSAASEIMTSLNIPNVEHNFFMSPTNPKYIDTQGNWNTLTDMLNKYKKLVCKANNGTGGNLVYRVNNQYELENAVFKILNHSRSIAISPYYEIDNEYRVIVLNGEIKLVYSKQRPYIIGDGKSSICTLICKVLEQGQIDDINNIIDEYSMDTVLKKDEICYLNWKHNLGQGAYAIIADTDSIRDKIGGFISDITDKMNIKFASVDVIECNNEYKVLEINSGVMMEHFSQQDANTYKIAKEIYRDAIHSMML